MTVFAADLHDAGVGEQAALAETAVAHAGIVILEVTQPRFGTPTNVSHTQDVHSVTRAGYPVWAGGLWLWRILVLSLFQAVVVPSGFRVTVQPHRWITTW